MNDVNGAKGGNVETPATKEVKQTKTSLPPPTVADLKDVVLAAAKAGYAIGKFIREKAAKDSNPYLILGVDKDTTTLQECTFERAPSEKKVCTSTLLKEWQLHKGNVQAVVHHYDDFWSNIEWEHAAISGAIMAALRTQSANTTEKNVEVVKLFTNPTAVRAAKNAAKECINLIMASTAVTKKATATAVGLGSFGTSDGATVE